MKSIEVNPKALGRDRRNSGTINISQSFDHPMIYREEISIEDVGN